MSSEKKAGQREVVADLLRYAEEHEVDLTLLLLALSWCEGADERADDEQAAADPVDVPAHYYPH